MRIISYSIIALTMVYAVGLTALIHASAGWSLWVFVALGVIPGIVVCYVAALVTFALVVRILKMINLLN